MSLSMVDSHHLHLVLTPYPPMALNRSDFKKYMTLTRVIGDISMLNILSAKSPLPMDNLRLFRIFAAETWLAIIILYSFLTTVSYFLWSHNSSNHDKHQTVFIDFIGIVFHQSIRSFDPHQNYVPFVMLWYLTIFIFSRAFSGVMLTVLVKAREYYRIDSIGIIVFLGLYEEYIILMV